MPDGPYCEGIEINVLGLSSLESIGSMSLIPSVCGYGRGYYFRDHGDGATNDNF